MSNNIKRVYNLDILLEKYQKRVFFKENIPRLNKNYEFNIKKEEYNKSYLRFIKLRNNDNKIKNKLKNMYETSLFYMNNHNNLNYKFSICRLIYNNYFNFLLKKDILIITYQKKNLEKSWCNRITINDSEELKKNLDIKKNLIIINYREVKLLKKLSGTILFDFTHLEHYVNLLIWSLNNINDKGYITLYVGLTMEPGLRDLIILLCYYSDVYYYSLNYYYGLDSLSSSFVFYNIRSKKKLINELKYILKIKKVSHGFLKKNNDTKVIIDKINKINIFLIERYISFSKWYNSINFNEKIKKKIIDYSLNLIIYYSLKPNKSLLNLIKSTKEELIILPNNKKIKIKDKLSINFGIKIYNFIIKNKVKSYLQLGINYGSVLLYIVSALSENKGIITLIIPKQKTTWNNIGIKKLINNKLIKNIKTLYDNDSSNYSLSKLIKNKEKFNLIYINDWYKTGYSLLNIFYSILLLNKGGYLIINNTQIMNKKVINENVVAMRHLFKHNLKELNDKQNKFSKKINIFIKKSNFNFDFLTGGNKEQFIYVPLIEGLGNKIFLFAAAYSLGKQLNLKVKMGLYSSGHDKFGSNQIHYIFPNLRSGDRILKHHITFLKDITISSSNTIIYSEKNKVLTKKNNILMTGYFQGFIYFKKYIQELKNILKINNDIIDNINKEYKNIINNNKTIGIHIRHGDMYKMMLQTNGYLKFPILKKEYYIEAIKKIKNIKNYKIIYFTDNAHDWIKNNLLSLNNNSIISTNNNTDEDLYLMSECDYLICSNSTLSYWAGIIGRNKTVIAPKYVMNIGGSKNLKFDDKEYYPNNWIILDNKNTSIWYHENK
jgi:hypothetical protein